MEEGGVRQHFREQAAACARLGSAFYGRFVAECGERLREDTAAERSVLSWSGRPRADALALRFVGLVRYLALRGDVGLQRLYDDARDGSLSEADWNTIQAALIEAGHDGLQYLKAPVQTNEVGRCFALQAAFRHLVAATGLPLDLYEVGASAGLNMLWDAWFYDGGTWRWGDPDAPVTLRAQWYGGVPESSAPQVVGRRASDLYPLNMGCASDQLRLLSYIWPDQAERIDRTWAAMARAAESSLIVEEGDAEGWLRTHLPVVASSTLRVVYHSIMEQYLAPTARERFRAALCERGAASTADSPLAWVRLEPCSTGTHAELSVMRWPGAAAQVLAECDFQGRWVRWLV